VPADGPTPPASRGHFLTNECLSLVTGLSEYNIEVAPEVGERTDTAEDAGSIAGEEAPPLTTLLKPLFFPQG